MDRRPQPGSQLALALPPPKKRKRPGPKPRKGGSAPHAPRPALARRFPVHVTLRAKQGTWQLRSRRCMRPILKALGSSNRRDNFKVSAWSVQGNHIHLLVEAIDALALARGMQGFASIAARRLNRVMARTGMVWLERYHARILRTPREVRAALAYVLDNFRRHAAEWGQRLRAAFVDPCCSLAFTEPVVAGAGPPVTVVAPAGTWLLSTALARLRDC